MTVTTVREHEPIEKWQRCHFLIKTGCMRNIIFYNICSICVIIYVSEVTRKCLFIMYDFGPWKLTRRHLPQTALFSDLASHLTVLVRMLCPVMLPANYAEEQSKTTAKGGSKCHPSSASLFSLPLLLIDCFYRPQPSLVLAPNISHIHMGEGNPPHPKPTCDGELARWEAATQPVLFKICSPWEPTGARV